MKLQDVYDARSTFQIAEDLLRSARTDLQIRQAAELAYLAATQAADVAAVHLGRSPPDDLAGRLGALRALDKSTTADTVEDFADAREILHKECFHEGRCREIRDGFAAVKRIVNAVNRTVGFEAVVPTKRKR